MIREENIFPEFLENYEKIKCQICKRVSQECYVSECLDIFCSDCLKEFKNNKFKCPLHNNLIDLRNMKEFYIGLFSQKIYCSCPFLNCKWVGNIFQYNRYHLNSHKKISHG